MLHEIHLENFEGHKNTVIKDLSPGFNLFFGDSNAGKTSITRGVRLLSQNEFNPESVRIDQDNCKVFMRTDKGSVGVTRGKSNTWDIENSDGKQTFEKIGVNSLKEAEDVLVWAK